MSGAPSRRKAGAQAKANGGELLRYMPPVSSGDDVKYRMFADRKLPSKVTDTHAARVPRTDADDARGTHPRAAYIREVLVNHQRSTKAKP